MKLAVQTTHPESITTGQKPMAAGGLTAMSRQQREIIREIERLTRQARYLESLRLRMINQPHEREKEHEVKDYHYHG